MLFPSLKMWHSDLVFSEHLLFSFTFLVNSHPSMHIYYSHSHFWRLPAFKQLTTNLAGNDGNSFNSKQAFLWFLIFLLHLCWNCLQAALLTRAALLQANLPLLQRELLHCARLAKQNPAQYLAQHEQLLLDASTTSPVDSSELLLDVNENGKRRTPDRWAPFLSCPQCLWARGAELLQHRGSMRVIAGGMLGWCSLGAGPSHPTWPWMLPEMVHPPPLWETSVSPPSIFKISS